MDVYREIPTSVVVENSTANDQDAKSKSLKRSLKAKWSSRGTSASAQFTDSRQDAHCEGNYKEPTKGNSGRFLKEGGLNLGRYLPTASHSTGKQRQQPTSDVRDGGYFCDSAHFNEQPATKRDTTTHDDHQSVYASIRDDVTMQNMDRKIPPNIDADVTEVQIGLSAGDSSSSDDSQKAPALPPRPSRASGATVKWKAVEAAPPGVGGPVLKEDTSPESVGAQQWIRSIDNGLFQKPGTIVTSPDSITTSGGVRTVPMNGCSSFVSLPCLQQQQQQGWGQRPRPPPLAPAINGRSLSSSASDCPTGYGVRQATQEFQRQQLPIRSISSAPFSGADAVYEEANSLVPSDADATLRRQMNESHFSRDLCCKIGNDGIVRYYRPLPRPSNVVGGLPPPKPPKPSIVQLFWARGWVDKDNENDWRTETVERYRNPTGCVFTAPDCGNEKIMKLRFSDLRLDESVGLQLTSDGCFNSICALSPVRYFDFMSVACARFLWSWALNVGAAGSWQLNASMMGCYLEISVTMLLGSSYIFVSHVVGILSSISVTCITSLSLQFFF